MDPDFELKIEEDGPAGGIRVLVAGEIDLATPPRVDAAIDDCELSPGCGSAVLLDLTGVTFIDGSGLRVVLRANDALAGRLRIAPSAASVRLFDVAGVGDRLPLVGDGRPAVGE